jgi:hypothetical protein
MVSKNPGLIGADKLSPSLKSHDLVQLANDAGLPLSESETSLLAWVSEVVIWKARYSVPTNTKYGDAFFHRLDNISLPDAEACIEALESIFDRTNRPGVLQHRDSPSAQCPYCRQPFLRHQH